MIGEKKCFEEYDDILEEANLPATTRELLLQQKLEVQQALRQLDILEDAHDDYFFFLKKNRAISIFFSIQNITFSKV